MDDLTPTELELIIRALYAYRETHPNESKELNELVVKVEREYWES